MVPVPCKSYGKDKEFDYNFLVICTYLNFVKKKLEDNLTAKINHNLLHLNFVQSIGKLYVIFFELCMKRTLLLTLKGSNSYKNVIKCIILESSLKCANGLLTIP
jgi:hypothetical protein